MYCQFYVQIETSLHRLHLQLTSQMHFWFCFNNIFNEKEKQNLHLHVNSCSNVCEVGVLLIIYHCAHFCLSTLRKKNYHL